MKLVVVLIGLIVAARAYRLCIWSGVSETWQIPKDCTDLQYDRPPSSANAAQESIKVALAALEKNAALTELWLGGNVVNRWSLPALTNALHNNTVLTSLSLVHGHIGEDSAQLLAAALKVNKKPNGARPCHSQ
jgi:hypothetical protein